jgi:hypothetical protein
MDLEKIQKLLFGVALAFIAISLCVLTYWTVSPTKSCPADDPDCMKTIRQHESRNGLRLHEWYAPTSAIGWSYERLEWSNQGQYGRIMAHTPVYVVERRGSVAVCRGAVAGVMLIPDGESACWFVPVRERGDIGEIGDMPKKTEVKQALPAVNPLFCNIVDFPDSDPQHADESACGCGPACGCCENEFRGKRKK